MLSYLSSETNFIKAYGNRTLLLIFLCALTRTAEKPASASAFGLSINLNPGIIAVYGPLLALLLIIGLKAEADTLYIARQSILSEIAKLPTSARRVNRAIYALFCMPAITALFLVVQYYQEVVPVTTACTDFDRTRQFYDLAWLSGTGSMYCIRDLKDGMPWIYPPAQIYIYGLITAACLYLTWGIIRNWEKARSAKS